MLRNLYRQSTAWATRLRNRFESDPFLESQVKTAGLYLGFCIITLLIVGGFADHQAARIFSHMLADPTFSPEEAQHQMAEVRFMARAFYVFLFAFGAYVLIGLAFKPIKDMTELQRRFIANISHELRTPLTVARTDIEVALKKKDALTLPEAKVALERTLADVDHVSRVILFLLSISDFQNHRSKFASQAVSLSSVIHTVEERYLERARDAGVTLVVELEESLTIKGNPFALEKMLSNLVRNALAYTPREAKVGISLTDSGPTLTLLVTNMGTTIPPKDLPHVFEPFYRGANAVAGGSGLGLSLVKEIVRLHGGSVRIESSAKEGTRIFVQLPK